MDDIRSTPTLPRPPQSKAKREEVIDKTLESISNTLNVLNEVKGFIPVSAVGNVVPVLKLIVEQISVSIQHFQLKIPSRLFH